MTPKAEKPTFTPEERKLAHELLPYLVQTGWIESRRQQQAVDAEGRPVPWITYPALSFLERRVTAEMSVFEFGSGNSTLWWAERVRDVTAVEHDESWATRVAARMPPNASVAHVALVADGDYSRFAQRSGRRYQVIVVDGRDRVNCALASVESLAPDGVMVWDNTERKRYAVGLRRLSKAGFRRIDFRGPSPINTFESQTSVLYRPRNCLGI